jgi:hypothetical protein
MPFGNTTLSWWRRKVPRKRHKGPRDTTCQCIGLSFGVNIVQLGSRVVAMARQSGIYSTPEKIHATLWNQPQHCRIYMYMYYNIKKIYHNFYKHTCISTFKKIPAQFPCNKAIWPCNKAMPGRFSWGTCIYQIWTFQRAIWHPYRY